MAERKIVCPPPAHGVDRAQLLAELRRAVPRATHGRVEFERIAAVESSDRGVTVRAYDLDPADVDAVQAAVEAHEPTFQPAEITELERDVDAIRDRLNTLAAMQAAAEARIAAGEEVDADHAATLAWMTTVIQGLQAALRNPPSARRDNIAPE